MPQILVIEDDKEQRVALIDLFTKLGHVTTEAWDGSNAAHKADQFTFDMIVANLELTKITMMHFLKALRLGKTNRLTPVILYHKSFDEEVVSSLSRFGRVQFITSPIVEAVLTEKVALTIKAAVAASQEHANKKKAYTFSKTSLEQCAKSPVEAVEAEFFRFYPAMLQQMDAATVDFGIWLKGSKDLLEYVGTRFTPEQNKKHIEDIVGVLQRMKGALELYVRKADKQKLYDHVQRLRISRLADKNLRDSQREVSDIFHKLTMCASHFSSGDVDMEMVTGAEQLAMFTLQKLSEKGDLISVLIDLFKKDPQMYDFVALVTITAVALGRKMGLQDVVLKKLSLACFFHDVGMALLNMPLIVDRQMTAEEHALYRDHPSAGTDQMNLLEAKGLTFPEEVYMVMMQHHEKFNGNGFPNQRKGRLSRENPTGIHLLASIVAVADRFALYLLNESNAGAIEQNRIVNAIFRLTGEYDPAVLKAFKEVFATGRDSTVSWEPT